MVFGLIQFSGALTRFLRRDIMALRISKYFANMLVDPHSYAEGAVLDEMFKTLRATAPLAVAYADGHDPFWVLTRHADIMEVERQHDIFRNSDRSSVIASSANNFAQR